MSCVGCMMFPCSLGLIKTIQNERNEYEVNFVGTKACIQLKLYIV